MEKTSSSKCTGFSLTFARGLLWRQAVEAHVDLQPKAWWQSAWVADLGLDLFQMVASVEDGKS
jgi:hypothetical protein